jgi:DNA-binding response OmpR family regulator
MLYEVTRQLRNGTPLVEYGQRTGKHADAIAEPAGRATLYRVGDLLIDVGRERVTRNDREIPLAKLTFDLLAALVRAAPDLVSLEDLMQRVWPGLVVGVETVSQRVMKLRAL